MTVVIDEVQISPDPERPAAEERRQERAGNAPAPANRPAAMAELARGLRRLEQRRARLRAH